MVSLPTGGFEDGHDFLHLIRVVEYAPRGPQALLPPDAEMITARFRSRLLTRLEPVCRYSRMQSSVRPAKT